MKKTLEELIADAAKLAKKIHPGSVVFVGFHNVDGAGWLAKAKWPDGFAKATRFFDSPTEAVTYLIGQLGQQLP